MNGTTKALAIVAVLAVAGLLALPLLGSATAPVTLEEYNAVRQGMSLDAVNKIVGFRGTLASSTEMAGFPKLETEINANGWPTLKTTPGELIKSEFYVWENGDKSRILVIFTNGKATFKAQRGLK